MKAAVILAFALLLAACQSTASSSQNVATAAKPQTAPNVVDFTCTSNDQCTLKNVGNCCGEYPACVNVDSPTFPEQVKSECARNGVSGVCGFPVLEGCQCVQGRCEGIKGVPSATSIK